jgi:hypothetical protein
MVVLMVVATATAITMIRSASGRRTQYGVGGREIREGCVSGDSCHVNVVADWRALRATDQQRVDPVHNVVVERAAAAALVRAAGEHGLLDFEKDAFLERLRRVNDQEIMEEQLG